MIKTAKKYNTNLAALKFAPHISARLPAWYHIRAKPRPLTGIASKCLLRKHATATVADLIRTASRLKPSRDNQHTPSLLCICIECSRDRIRGCRNPHTCAKEALTRVTGIAPKLNPLSETGPHDNLTLTPNRKARNRAARATNGIILFDPTVTCRTDLSDCFCTFTDPTRDSQNPARRQCTPGTSGLQNQTITVYTDGAGFHNGKENAKCGSGIWVVHQQTMYA
jgi:hypothetical protein